MREAQTFSGAAGFQAGAPGTGSRKQAVAVVSGHFFRFLKKMAPELPESEGYLRQIRRKGSHMHQKGPHGLPGGSNRRGPAFKKRNFCPSCRAILSLTLVAALCLAGLPATALAATVAGNNSVAGEVGIKLDVPSGSKVEEREVDGTVGVRLTIPAETPAEQREVAGDIGIRLVVPASNDTDERIVEDSVGIRLVIPQADDTENRIVEGNVGIRLKVPPENAVDGREITGDVGVRLVVPASNEVESREVTGDIGIRLSVPTEHTVTFNANGGTFKSTGLTTWKTSVAHGSTLGETLGITSLDAIEAPEHNRLFLGWFRDEGCVERFDPNEMVGADIMVYAGWSDIVDVRFHASYGEFVDPGDGGYDATRLKKTVASGAPGDAADPGDATAGGYLLWHEAVPGKDAYVEGMTLPKMKNRGNAEWLGWWVRNESGAWLARIGDDGTCKVGEEVADALPVSSGGVIDLYARWVASDVKVQFEDGLTDEDIDAGAQVTAWPMLDGSGGRQTVTLSKGQVPTTEISLDGDDGLAQMPQRPGYRLAGFWWPSADGKSDVKYYGADYSGAAAGSGQGAWTLGPDVADGWTQFHHALDMLDGSGGEGHDGIVDTLVLVARWDPTLQATVPTSLAFAVQQMGDDTPTATGPSADTFKIRNYSPFEVRVETIEAEGQRNGLREVFYTDPETKALVYADLDSAVRLRLSPDGNTMQSMDFDIATEAGTAPVSKPATLPFRLEAWQPTGGGNDGTAEKPGELKLLFELDLPKNIRAQASGAKGEIARVTFTIGMRSVTTW